MKGIRMLAALIDDDGDRGLLNAARDLSGAFNNLLISLNPSDRKVSSHLLQTTGFWESIHILSIWIITEFFK